MDQERSELLQKYAEEKGISIEELEKELDKLDKRGELGFGYLKKIIPSEIQNQKDARSLFRMVAQEGNFSDSDEYIETFPIVQTLKHGELGRRFSNYTLTRERLQRRNVLITTEMWHVLVENPKECISGKFLKKSVDYGKEQITFSQLFKLANLENIDESISHRENCDALILRTIQFDFLNDSKMYEEGRPMRLNKSELQKMSAYYDKFLMLADEQYINNIYEIADNCWDFSIHEYYLPYGFSREGLKNAVLLMRYDHCSDRHINSILPKYYNMSYSTSVTLPHFHFNEGLGQVYKLLTKDGQGNFGSGFAISVPDMIGYLNQLKVARTLPQQERDLLLNNDFGMPFLTMRKQGYALSEWKHLQSSATNMTITNLVGDNRRELQQAFNFLNLVNRNETTNLEDFGIISKHKNNDTERQR